LLAKIHATGYEAGMTVAGPLSGLIILDLTRVLAGPYCTMVLSDLGARIIKVEPPEGDDSRRYGPFINGISGYFTAFNRSKESIAIDLKNDADRIVFERLLARADVVVENFRPGTMEKLGYGWDCLHSRFPRLIYAAASGFGHSGPYANRPAYDMVVQAMGGIMSITGQPDGPPTRVGSSIGDISAGLFTAIGIVSALYDRARTKTGMKVDVAMLDCQVAILENAITRYFATGRSPGPLGARHASIAPFAAFAVADGHLVIAAGTDALFVRLCQSLGRPDLAGDPHYATNASRADHVDALAADLELVLKEKPIAHWLDVLGNAGIPCGPINDVGQVLADPQVLARNMVVSLDDPAMAGLRLAGNPIKLSGYEDPPTRAAAPALDADRRRILEDD
jgi:CoA:oxalate CoA-transferase